MLRLRDQGNTVLVVEHDADMIKVADTVVDMGLGTGRAGRTRRLLGHTQDLMLEPRSLTAKYLRDELAIPVPAIRRKSSNQRLRILGASEHNLKTSISRCRLGCSPASPVSAGQERARSFTTSSMRR